MAKSICSHLTWTNLVCVNKISHLRLDRIVCKKEVEVSVSVIFHSEFLKTKKFLRQSKQIRQILH